MICRKPIASNSRARDNSPASTKFKPLPSNASLKVALASASPAAKTVVVLSPTCLEANLVTL